MRTIHVLDPSIANKIAAGEVVERPASVMKELLENSIDAGATRIFIDVEEAGKTLIRVADNGQGIPKSEVPIAFLRHATSKIHTIDDIYAIESLGFRGEALASIASVSKVEMTSKTKDSEVGLKYVIEGGIALYEGPISTNNGTTIAIRELFYNTPARFKFLKSDTSENMAILDIIHKIALSHPEVALQYKNNGRLLFQTKGDGKRDLILYDLWGADLHKQLMQYQVQTELYSLTAYFSRPSYTRGNRNYQLLIVNGRAVRSKAITDGVFDGYRSLLMVNRFPAWVVVLDLKPESFDINIHPAKMDIKFQSEQMIKNQMSDHVRAALLNSPQIPSLQSSTDEKSPVSEPFVYPRKTVTANSFNPKTFEVHEQKAIFGDNSNTAQRQPFKLLEAMIAYTESELAKAPEPDIQDIQQVLIEEEEPHQLFLSMRPMGAFMNAYILAEYNNTLYIIDQHAAHERILFEAFLKAERSQSIERQILMIPLTKSVDVKTMLCFEAYAHHFEQLGFGLEKLGERTLILREAPSLLSYEQSTALMETLLELVQLEADQKTELSLEDFARKACKSAVKAHDALTLLEIKQLLKDLATCDNPYTCPHGRPISIELNQHEIEKRFKRI